MWKWRHFVWNTHSFVHSSLWDSTPRALMLPPWTTVWYSTFSGWYRKSNQSTQKTVMSFFPSDHQSMNHTIYVKTRSFNPCSSFKRDLHFTLLPLPYKTSIECNDNYQNFLSFSFHPLLKRQPETFNSGDYLNSIVVYLDLNWESIFHSCWCINYFWPRLRYHWCYDIGTGNPLQSSLGGDTSRNQWPSHPI